MKIRNAILVAALAAGTSAAVAVSGCAVSSHAVEPSTLGVPSTGERLEALIDAPGPVEIESIAAAEWAVERAGLVNLEHPKAQAAGLGEGLEPITIYFHVLRHPTQGAFIVDSGVERALMHDPERSAVQGLVRSVAGVDDMRVLLDLASWLAQQEEPLAGVFLTHLHLDHVLGLPDVPHGTPIYTGPGEAAATSFLNVFTQPTTDRTLAGHDPIREWQFQQDPGGRFAGVLDVFGDGSLWALHVPGHTPGSTAYLARTKTGPVLFTGDACHTAFGWIHGVEPGTFSSDQPTSRTSLDALESLAQRHPTLDVRLGHQALDPQNPVAHRH